MTDPAAHTPCDGSSECASERHMHGCFADRGNCDHPSEHAAHTPSDSAGAPDIDALVETIKDGLLRRNDRGHAALSDLAAIARAAKELRAAFHNAEIFVGDSRRRAEAAEADRDRAQALADTQEKWAKSEHERADRLARRVAELEDALDALRWKPGEDCWCDVKSTDYPDMHMPRCKAARAELAGERDGDIDFEGMRRAGYAADEERRNRAAGDGGDA